MWVTDRGNVWYFCIWTFWDCFVSLNSIISIWIYFPLNGITSFFMTEKFHCVHTTFSLSIPLWMDTQVGAIAPTLWMCCHKHRHHCDVPWLADKSKYICIFWSGWNTLHPTNHIQSFSFVYILHRTVVEIFFIMAVIMTRVRWNVKVLFICISLMVKWA